MRHIAFAGTPDFASHILKALLDAGWPIQECLTQPDRPKGRGQTPTPSPVKTLALQHQIPVWQPETLRNPEAIQRFAASKPDLLIVAAYGLILPKEILAIPTGGCLNIHASILPRWRGAAPIQHALLAGDSETGISLMQMDVGLDTGPVYVAERCAIADDETGGSLHDRLAEMGAGVLLKHLENILAGQLTATPQNASLATHAPKIHKSDARIDWNDPAVNIVRKIRAFNPWPMAFTEYQGQALRIHQAAVLSTSPPEKGSPGTLLNFDATGMDVQTGTGVVRIQMIQRAGGKPLSMRDFFNSQANKFTPQTLFD